MCIKSVTWTSLYYDAQSEKHQTISDSSKDISDCHLSKDIPTLMMVKEERVAENKEQKKQKNFKICMIISEQASLVTLDNLYFIYYIMFTALIKIWMYHINFIFWLAHPLSQNIPCSTKVSDPWQGRYSIMIFMNPFTTANLTGESEPHYSWSSSILQCQQGNIRTS